MTLSMHQAAAPQFLRQLNTLDGILAKGESFAAERGIDEAELTDARLAPDMFPLTRQVQVACDMAKGCMARLAGQEVPSWADEEKSFADLRARVAKTIAFIESVPADDVDGSEDRAIAIKLRDRTLEMTGQPYLLHFALPNFYFHVTTSYAILRYKGVPLTKQDYMGGV